jgi:hypothetical protein
MNSQIQGTPYIKRTAPHIDAAGYTHCRYQVSVMAVDFSRDAIVAENLDYTEAQAMVKSLGYRAVVEA